MDIRELKKQIEEVLASADRLFEKAAEVERDVTLSWPFPSSDSYWDAVDDSLRSESRALQSRLLEIVRAIIVFAKGSPLLSSADERDLSEAVKAMRASLRFRSYESWDTEVLHDEGTVLGVKRAGQSESAPLAPTDAKDVFRERGSRILGIVELIEASPPGSAGDTPAQVQFAATAAYRPNTAFIMMWLDPSLTDIADAIKDCFKQFGITAVRADDIEHEDVITKRILDEIKTSEFLIADLTGERPSVYYEVGFAHALGRRVMLYRKEGTAIHFDLAAYNCPEYKNIRDLKEKLARRLEQATNRTPT